MIPAILSCIFVVYLYHTLNESPHSPESFVENDASNLSLEELTERLRILQSRIEQLDAHHNNGGNR